MVATCKENMTEEQIAETQPETQVEAVQPQEEVKQEVTQEAAKNTVDRNWEQANQVLRFQKQKIDELEEKITKLSTPQPKQEEEPDEFANLDPEDVITVGKARALAEKVSGKKA